MQVKLIKDLSKESKRLSYLIYEYSCSRCQKTTKTNATSYLARLNKYEGFGLVCRSCALTLRNLSRDPAIQKRMAQKVADNRRGKTFNEIFGVEKSAAVRQKLSEKNSGVNNPNFGGKHSHGFRDNPLSGPWEQRFGKEEADRRKRAVSKRLIGSGNPMYGRPSPKGGGAGWSGWLEGEYFRSLLELSFMLHLKKSNINYKSAETKDYLVTFKDGDVNKTYHPDFVLDDGRIIEVKPFKLVSTLLNTLKFKAAIERFGDKFSVVTEKDFERIEPKNLIQYVDSKQIVLIDRYMEKLDAYR